MDIDRVRSFLPGEKYKVGTPRSLKMTFLGFFLAAVAIMLIVEFIYKGVGYIGWGQFLVNCAVITPIAAASLYIAYLIVRRAVLVSERAEEQLKAEIAFQESATEALPDVFFVLDTEGNLVSWNHALREISGYTDEEISKMKPVEFFASGAEEELRDSIVKTLTTDPGRFREFTIVTKDGREAPFEFFASAVTDHRGEKVGIAGIARDLTERKRIEKELKKHRENLEEMVEDRARELEKARSALEKSEQRLQGILASVSDHMSMVDEEHNIVWANRVARSIFGEDLEGRKCYEAYHRREVPCEPCVVSMTFDDGEEHEHETEVVGAAGNRMLFWCRTGIAAYNPDGSPKLVVELSRDITDRKRSEDDLRRANAELESYAHVVSHDLRGPLSVISGACDMLQQRFPEITGEELDDTTGELLQLISRNVDKAHGLVGDILTLAEAGQEPNEISEVDLKKIMDRIIEERGEDIAAKGMVVYVDDELGGIRANSTQVYQLFSNLISNAIKFNDSEEPVVEVCRLEEDGESLKKFLVRDNGSGISPDLIDSIFDPFVTGGGGDLGIGLSTVKKIVNVYGGWIRAFNDRGACFEFILKDK